MDVILVGISIIIYNFNMFFRQWVIYFFTIISIIGILYGIMQKVKGQQDRITIIVTLGIIFLMITPIIYLLHSSEHVIKKDNKKYVVYVNHDFKVHANYYEYVNFFLRGNEIRIKEYYGERYDPFDGKHSDFQPKSVCYYDEEGKKIKYEKE